MSFPRYEKYKDSGVEWLGEVPKHWEIKPLRWFSICSSGESLSTEKIEFGPDIQNSIPVIGGNGIMGFTNQKNIQKSVLAIGRVGALCGNVHIVHHPAWITDNALVLDASSESFNICYLAAMLIIRNLNDIASKTAQPLITGTQVRDQRIPCPPLQEQSAINAFLDRETAKIDDLIAEQQKLIELLKEKRQAVISHAVTKGLNPDAKMKDSGIEWLGEIPEYWERIQLGRLCLKVSDGPHFSPTYVDDGILFLSARNIKVDGWSLEDAKFISENDYNEFSKRIIPEKGNILYTKGGTTGIARVVDLEEIFQVWVHVAVLKIDQSIADPYYISYSLNSLGCYEQSQLYTRGATNNDLGLTRMIKIWLALPSPQEQSAIVAHLNCEISKLETLISEAQKAITLLQERRTALISAAVSGKIDVRGFVSDSESVVAA